MGIVLTPSSKGDSDVKYLMSIHYSKPKGFVGRQIVYKIHYDDTFCGAIVGGSATKHLPGRNEFFDDKFNLNAIVNNTFFHLLPGLPLNTGSKVLRLFRNNIIKDWELRIGAQVS